MVSDTLINRLENGSIEIRLTLPWKEILNKYGVQVEKAVKLAVLPGFRQGTAPRNMVEPQLDKNKLYSAAVQDLLPAVFSAAVKQYALKPILYPKLTITKGEEGQDWEFLAVTCEAPLVVMPDYKKSIASLGKLEETEKTGKIIDFLRQKTAMKIPDLLVEEEASHRLSALAENITRLGLSVDSYLKTKNLTPQDLKSQVSNEARASLEAEFILRGIQEQEKLTDRKSVLNFLQSLV